MEQNKIQASWCGDICPQLAAFNKVYNLRGGRGLVQNIVLIGSDEDIRECAETEAKFFAACGMTLNEAICEDKYNEMSPQTYFLDNDDRLERKPGSIYFFKSCKAKDKNVFDVTGLFNNRMFDFTELIDLLGFPGLTNEMLQSSEVGEKLKEAMDDMSLEQIVTNTLLAHYMEHDDDICRMETDFAWLLQRDSNVSSLNPLPPLMPENKKNNKLQEIPNRKEKQKKKQGPLLSGFKKISSSKDDGTENVKAPENVQKKNIDEQEKEGTVPQPIPKEKMSPPFIVKESLTKKEEENNCQMLNELCGKYKETIQYIKGTCNSQWNIIKNKMEDELKSSQFRTQWCPIYLEISNDLTSELYERLYGLDIATSEFQKNVVHQVVKLGCAFCANDWDEDITFLKPGIHYVECPNCLTERGFEKRELSEKGQES